MKSHLLTTLAKTALPLVALFGAASLPAQTFPLSENNWNNPDFVARFMGTYGFNTELNPSISREEKTIFDTIQPLVASNPRAAIAQLRAAITPQTSAALDQILANLYFQENDFDNAIRTYREAIRKFPNFYRAYQNLGRVHVSRNEFAEALPHLRKAIELAGGDGSLYGLLGYCYMNTGQSSVALDAYRMAVVLQPNSLDWKKGMLNCLLSTGQNQPAIALLYELIEREPANSDYWIWQANAFLALEQPTKAAANLEVVRSLGRANASSLLLLGDIYVNEELSNLAAASYLAALDSGSLTHRQAIRVVDTLTARGAYDEATGFITAYEGHASTQPFAGPDSLTWINAKARIAMSTGQNERAAGLLMEIIGQDPLNGRALLSLTDYHLGRDELPEAAIFAESASKVEATAVDGFIRLARVEVQRREFAKAVTHLRRAQDIRAQPYVAEYITRLEQAARR